MTYTKIGFKDRIDSKPTSYIVDGKPLEISKDNAGLKQKGTSLNADNLNHLEDGILQNDKNIQELKKSTTEILNNFGGRNYLLNSSLSSLSHWSKRFQTSQIDDYNKIEIKDNSCHIINTNQDLIGVYQNPNNLDIDNNYILSFYIKCERDIKMLVGFSDTSKTVSISSCDWKKQSFNIGIPSRKGIDCVLYVMQRNEAYIKNVKLEKGFTSTDWSVAPEEVVANTKRLDAIEQTLIDKKYMTVTQKL